MMESWGLVLIAACITALLRPGEGGQADGCTSEFPSIERMERVIDNQITGAPWDQWAIFPGTTFKCTTGTIRNLTFAAFKRSGTVFPELHLWRTRDNYKFARRITFNENNQVSSLIYQLNGTSIPFKEGDVLAFYQPSRDDSKSRILLAVRMPQPVQTMYRYSSTGFGNPLPRNPMVSVVTDPPNCASGFMSLETLQTLVLTFVGLRDIGRLVNHDACQQITPDINFTCDGVITKWIVGGFWVDNSALIPGPELQLWRKTTSDTYIKINGTFVTSSVNSDNGIFNDSSFSPIPFQAGDILGIFVPRSGSTRLRLGFELSRGPLNYYTVISPSTASTSPHTEFKLSDFTSSEVYRPLVSVEISVSESTTTHVQLPSSTASPSQFSTPTSLPVAVSPSSLTTTTSPSLSPSSSLTTPGQGSASLSPSSSLTTTGQGSASPSPSSSLTTTSDEVPGSIPSPSIKPPSHDNSPSPTVTKSKSTESSKPTVRIPDSSSQSGVWSGIGAGVGVALLLTLLAVVVLVVLLCVRRRRTSKVILQHQMTNFGNPVYEGVHGGSDGVVAIHGNIPAVLDGTTYESPYSNYDSMATAGPSHKETVAEFDNPLYSDTGPVTFSESTVYESTDFGGENTYSSLECSYVPTTVQREKMYNVYSTPMDGMAKSGECTEYAYVKTNAGRKSEYFEEENIYWAPATNVNDLYEQLSRHKYREIPREHIKVGEELGSGQFGVVNKGKWLAAVGGAAEVAIKTLQPEAKEEEKVKFLQEAAINGQFRHPNIVRLHGVVTVGEPVMIVLEFLSNGDLREFLNSLKSRPEGKDQSQLAQLCLSFTQHVASGMSYLAKKDFVHRDLAARNILVSEDRVCKVADFGMARDLDEGSYYVSHGGKIPVKWTSPEALHYKKYSTASDVWSFGCLMYEIWSLGHKPFEGYTNPQVLKLVTEGYRLAPPPGCPRGIFSIMMNCWHPDKSLRPSFSSLHHSLTAEPAGLLQWGSKGRRTAAHTLGAPLEAGRELHCDLQETYLQKH